MQQSRTDVFCMCETNVAFNLLSDMDLPKERFRGHWEASASIHSNNTAGLCNAVRQSGGTLMFCRDAITHRLIGRGSDLRKLGRWTWMRFRGQHNRTLRIATAYRPVISNGATSAYQQQKQVLQSKDIDTCPREVFLNDLAEAIVQWKQEGDQILVLGDFNDHVGGRNLTQFFAKLEMKEVFSQRHGQGPNTFAGGSLPIDGAFATSTVEPRHCGYTSVDWGTTSDHRLLWLDLPFDEIFGTQALNKSWKPAARRLKLIDPRIVERFLLHRRKLDDGSKILDRLRLIHQAVLDLTVTDEQFQILETLDQQRLEHILSADKACRKLRTGEVAWSPTYQAEVNKIRYLKSCIRYYNPAIKFSRMKSHTLYKQRQAANIPAVLDFKSAKEQLLEVFHNYNEVKHQDKELRLNYLQDLSLAIANDKQGDPKTIYDQLIATEQQKDLSRKFKALAGKTKGTLTRVEILDENNEWKEVCEKPQIEEGCINENTRRFTQANHTPALLPESIIQLGWTADTGLSEDILRGRDVSQTALHPSIKQLAPYLGTPASITALGQMSTDLSEEDYALSWKRTKEFTTTGRSGMHFGHMKASCLDKNTAEVDRLFLEISLKSGYALKRWHHGIDFCIPKKEDSIKVTKLRTIIFFECDFNHLNKIVGRRLMIHAEQGNSIAIEQYGSRKRKSAILHATNKQLTFDILRQEKMNASLLVLDAVSCYDRIAAPVASLCLRRQGAPLNVVKVMFNTLDSMKHYIRTAYGDSDDFYPQPNRVTRLHGILQGNGAGPMIWAMVSTPILQRMRDLGYGVPIMHPTTFLQFLVTAFSFVDDADFVHRLLHPLSPATEAQQTFNAWIEGLDTTGGDVSGEKSNWYALLHKWLNDHWIIRTKEEVTGEIHKVLPDGTAEPLTRLNCFTATKALGIMFAPDGNMKAQVRYLKSKAQKWGDQIRCGCLKRSEAWYSLNISIMKSIEYSLPATTMTKQELDEVMWPILDAGLSKSGICNRMTRNVVYSATKYQGLGLVHPFFVQGIRKLALLLKDNSSLPLLAHNISTTWELTRLESGLGPQFFLADHSLMIGIITHGWMASLWSFLSEYNISLTKPSCDILRFDGDCYLMRQVVMGNYSLKFKRIFNFCRIYLQVELFSDIVGTSGYTIRHSAWKGLFHPIRQQKVRWPAQPRPSESAWRIWRTILAQVFDLSETGRLRHPIATWDQDAADWKWWHSPLDDRLYEFEDERIYYRSIHQGAQRRTRHSLAYGDPHLHVGPVPYLTPVSTYSRQARTFIENTARQTAPRVAPAFINQWASTITNTRTGDLAMLRHAAMDGDLIAVCDGSYKDPYATAAWIITTRRLLQTVHIRGVARVPGSALDHDSHRAEVTGLMGIMWTVKDCIQKGELPNKITITVACDNDSALHYGLDINRYPEIECTFPDFDLLQQVRDLRLPDNKYRLQHVAGHQDDHITALSHWELLNVLVDHHAKEQRAELEITNVNPKWYPQLPVPRWSVTILNNVHQCKNLSQQLYDHVSQQQMEEQWDKRSRIQKEHFHHNDWNALEHAMRLVKPDRRIWIAKHAAGFSGVNAVRHRRKEITSDACPRCGAKETTNHVWICPQAQATDIWETSLISLQTWLQTSTSQPIAEQLIQYLRMWRTNTIPDLFPQQHQLARQQHLIGWSNVIEGRIANCWREAHEQYLIATGKTGSSYRWTAQLIHKMWSIAWDLWEHRNGIEHNTDLEKETTRTDLQVAQELQAGFARIPEIAPSQTEQEHLRSTATLHYKQSWLRNISEARARESRRGQVTTQAMDNMRLLMRNFTTLQH